MYKVYISTKSPCICVSITFLPSFLIFPDSLTYVPQTEVKEYLNVTCLVTLHTEFKSRVYLLINKPHCFENLKRRVSPHFPEMNRVK
jgi:hypothetical protein